MPSIGEKKKGWSSLHNGTASTPNDDVNPYIESPYSDPDIVSIDVGSKPVRYRVHRTVLSQSNFLFEKINALSWGAPKDLITLPDLDEVTAHTIVHHLYSGKYQALEEPSNSGTGIKSSYRLSILVYCAAVRYGLGGLASLAKEKITQWGEHVAILDVLSISREHAFPNLPQEDSWFSEYLQDTIKLAAKTDPELFLDSSFSDQIEGDKKFRHIVVKAMLASQSSETVQPQEQDSVEYPEDTQLEHGNEDRIDPPRPENSLQSPPPVRPEEELEVPYDETPPEPASEALEPEPEIIPEAPGNFGDSWGFPTSTIKKAKIDMKFWGHPELALASPEPEPEVVENEASVDAFPTKKKKKGKKGKEEPVIELEPPPEPVPEEPEPELVEEATPANDLIWGVSTKKKNKKKKQSALEPQLREGW